MSKITKKKEQSFLDTYMNKINNVWSEWFFHKKNNSFHKLSMKQREEILSAYRNELHRIQKKMNS